MYDYYRDGMQVMPSQNQFNPMAAMPEQMYNPMATMPMQNMYNPMTAMPMQNMHNPMATMPMQNMHNPMATMPMQNMHNPMATMPMQNMFPAVEAATEEELENLFPETYKVISPVVENACDKWMGKFGEKCPSNADVQSMVEDIYKKVEPAVEAAIKKSPVAEERQFFGGGRRVLRDFIGALLIASLIRREEPFLFRDLRGFPVFTFDPICLRMVAIPIQSYVPVTLLKKVYHSLLFRTLQICSRKTFPVIAPGSAVKY